MEKIPCLVCNFTIQYRRIHFLFILDEYGKYIIDNQLEKMMPCQEIEEC